MDIKVIRDLMLRFDKSSISKLKLEQKGVVLELEKSPDTHIHHSDSMNNDFPIHTGSVISRGSFREEVIDSTDDGSDNISDLDEVGTKIKSPMVGTFYSAPSPDSDAFVKNGDIVKIGDPLCVLEAMKIMNTFESEYECKILKILVKDGQAIEYDMPLFLVEKI